MAIGVESWHATRLSGVVTCVYDTPFPGRSAHFFFDRSGRPCDQFSFSGALIYSSNILDLLLLLPDASGTDGGMQSCVHKVSNRILLHGHVGNVNGGEWRFHCGVV
jgi:hypothetical protein